MAVAVAGKGKASMVAGAVRAVRRLVGRVFGEGRWVALILLLGLVALRVWDPVPVETMRVKVYDVYQQLKPRPAPEPMVYVADIDEASLAELGQWPWSRLVVGQLLLQLAQAGAFVGFDVVFSEPDRLSPGRFVESMPGLPAEVTEQLKGLPDNEAFFAQVLQATRAVLGQAGNSVATPGGVKPKAPALAVLNLNPDFTGDLNALVAASIADFPGLIANLPVLEEAAGGRGLFSVNPETDGIVRRIPAISHVAGTVYPTLAIEMLRVMTGASTILVRMLPPFGVEDVVLQGVARIPTDARGRLWPHFAKYSPVRYIPAKDIVSGTFDAAKLKGKLVILGASATGLRDIRATPVDDAVPGVEVHAQLLESILTNSLLTHPGWGDLVERLAVLVVGLLMIFGFVFIGAKWTILLFAVVAGGMFGGSWYLFSVEALLLDASYATLCAFLIYVVVTYLSYSREQAQRQAIRSAFSLYLAPAMVERVAADPGALKLGGEMKDLTLMFCDLRGFTTISEMFKNDPVALTTLINRFLTPMTDFIQGTGGTIDKYIGDCIMAFWNAPVDVAGHEAAACRAALMMRTGMKALNAQLEAEAKAAERPHVPLAIGIGLNSGEVCVGNMGSDQKLNYSVLGDAVNLASRLEGQSKTYHLDLVIGETTHDGARDFACIELDLIKVKGKTEPVRIFTIVGDEAEAKTERFRRLRDNHGRMLACYRAQDIDGARAGIAACMEDAEAYDLAGLYEEYGARLDAMVEDPPGPGWDGVFVAKSK